MSPGSNTGLSTAPLPLSRSSCPVSCMFVLAVSLAITGLCVCVCVCYTCVCVCCCPLLLLSQAPRVG